ncbi:MAG: hypothetical protein KGI06_06045 [Candidatus Micrarchaeota archaeon]|nr:hypothetical protein [Candidatus Micrarchaeota archaeon]
MNLAEQYLAQMIADAERRMDAAGIPRVVSVPCPYCERGRVLRAGQIERCGMCGGSGATITDAPT